MIVSKVNKMKDVGKRLSNLIFIMAESKNNGPIKNLDNELEKQGKLYAEVRHIRGKRLFEMKATGYKTKVEFIVRANAIRDDFDKNNKILFLDELYIIEYILPLDSDRLYKAIGAYKMDDGNGL